MEREWSTCIERGKQENISDLTPSSHWPSKTATDVYLLFGSWIYDCFFLWFHLLHKSSRKSNGVEKPLQAKWRMWLFANPDKNTSSFPLPQSHHAVHRTYFSSKWSFAPGTQRDQTLYEYPHPLWLQLIAFNLYWLLKARLGRGHCSYHSIPCYRNKNLLVEIPFRRDKR